MNAEYVAYAWRSGRIQIGRKLRHGALPLVTGPESQLRRLVRASSRHGYTHGVYLVPGLDPDGSDAAASDACKRYADYLAAQLQAERVRGGQS